MKPEHILFRFCSSPAQDSGARPELRMDKEQKKHNLNLVPSLTNGWHREVTPTTVDPAVE
jgi:hypothetical protein